MDSSAWKALTFIAPMRRKRAWLGPVVRVRVRARVGVKAGLHHTHVAEARLVCTDALTPTLTLALTLA